MNIFVTGAGGFLGKHIIRKLLESERGTIMATSLYREDLVEFEDNLRVIFVGNTSILNLDFEDIDVVINCAFPRTMAGARFANGLDFINALLKKIQPHKGCGFIDISSQSVYSFTRKAPATEDTQKVLEGIYDVGKYCMEMLTDARLEGHKYIHLRLASLIGSMFDQRLVNKFVLKVIAGEDIVLTGGQQLFGFLDVRDCADAICRVLQLWDRVEGCGEIYNIGAEDSNSLQMIANTVLEVGQEFGYNQSKVLINKTDDWLNSCVDARKFYSTFDWKPKYTMRDTVQDIFKAHCNEQYTGSSR